MNGSGVRLNELFIAKLLYFTVRSKAISCTDLVPGSDTRLIIATKHTANPKIELILIAVNIYLLIRSYAKVISYN